MVFHEALTVYSGFRLYHLGQICATLSRLEDEYKNQVVSYLTSFGEEGKLRS